MKGTGEPAIAIKNCNKCTTGVVRSTAIDTYKQLWTLAHSQGKLNEEHWDLMKLDLKKVVEEKKSSANNAYTDVTCEVRVTPTGNSVRDFQIDMIVFLICADPTRPECVNVRYAGSCAQLVNASAQMVDRVT